jgi:Uma2 family endonuclease
MRRATITPMSEMPAEATIPVPASVRFPVELEPPLGFRPEEAATWPRVEGRLEYLGGRLLFMPPCGATQQGTCVGVVVILGTWGAQRPDFFVGSNEAGVLLGDDARGADAAVWRRETIGPIESKFVRVPPILAVEVAGRDEGEVELRAKAQWYLARGVQVVWVLLPEAREVIVVERHGERRHRRGERLPPHAALPGLEPLVDDFFRQLD